MVSVQDKKAESPQTPSERDKTAGEQPLPSNSSQEGTVEQFFREETEKTTEERKQGQEQLNKTSTQDDDDDSSKLETKKSEVPNPPQSQSSSPETQTTEVTSNLKSRETLQKASQQQESLMTTDSVVGSTAATDVKARDSHTRSLSQGSSLSTQVTSNESRTEKSPEAASQSATSEQPPQSTQTQESVSPEKAKALPTENLQSDEQQPSVSDASQLEHRPQHVQWDEQTHSQQQSQAQNQTVQQASSHVQQQPPQGQQQQAETTEQEYVRLPGQATDHIVKKTRGRFKLLQEAPPSAADSQTSVGAPPPGSIAPAVRERASSTATSKSNVSHTANAQTFDGSGAPIVKRKGRFMVTNVKDPGLVAVPVQAVMTSVATQPMDPSQTAISGTMDGQTIAYGAQMMMVAPAAHLSMPQQVQYAAAAPPQEGSNPATATATFQQTAAAVQPVAVVGSSGPVPLPTLPAETAAGAAIQPAAGEDPQAKPKGQPRKPSPHPNAGRGSGGGLAGQSGLGKVFYFLDQMRLEVTDADKTIKTLQSDMKFLKEKNKELEAKARETERKLHDEKCLREAAEGKVRALKKKLRHLKGESVSLEPETKDEASCDQSRHSRSNSVANIDIETLDGPPRGLGESRTSLNSGDSRASFMMATENIVDNASKITTGNDSATSTSPNKTVASASANRKPQASVIPPRKGETATTPPRARESLPKSSAPRMTAATSSLPVQTPPLKRGSSGASLVNKPNQSDPAVTPVKVVQRNASNQSMQPHNIGQGASVTANGSPSSAPDPASRIEGDLSSKNVYAPQVNSLIRNQPISTGPPPQSPMPTSKPLRESSSLLASQQKASTKDFDPLCPAEQVQPCEDSRTIAESASVPVMPSTSVFVMDQPAMAVPIVGMPPAYVEGSDLMSFQAQPMADMSLQQPMSNPPNYQDFQRVSAPGNFQNIQQPMILVSQQQLAGLQDLQQSNMMTMQQHRTQQQPPGGNTAIQQGVQNQGASGSAQTNDTSWNPESNSQQMAPKNTQQQYQAGSQQHQWSHPQQSQPTSGVKQGVQNQNTNPQHQWPQPQPSGNPYSHTQNQGASEATPAPSSSWNKQQQWAQQHSAPNTHQSVQNQGLRQPTQPQSNWNSQQRQRATTDAHSDWLNPQQQQQHPSQQQPALNGQSDWLSTEPNAGAPLQQPVKDRPSSDPFEEMARRSRPPQAPK